MAVDVTTHLHLNIQNTNSTLLGHILDSLNAGSIMIATELCMLDEVSILYKLQELLFIGEIVFSPVLFAIPWASRRVRDREAEAIGIFLEQTLEERRLPST
jgi:hypothetical protein